MDPRPSSPPFLLISASIAFGALLTLALQHYLPPKNNKSSHHPIGDGLLPSPDIRNGIEECIGNTPLIRIKSLSDATGCEILGKAEFLEPGGSIKDRVALSMIKSAEEQGILRPYHGDVVYEGTVGSTGVSLAMLCRARGYLAHICMPNDQSLEKNSLLSKLGSLITTLRPAPIVDPSQFVNVASHLASTHHTLPNSTPGSHGFFTDQFESPANHLAHYTSTGPEILRQCGGHLDAFVAGAGTGGTISGVASYLKPLLPTIRITLADPPGSGLYNKITHGVLFSPFEKEGTKRRSQVDTIVEGIGINRLTANMLHGLPYIDDAVRVTDAQALAMAQYLVEKDGLFLGSSSAVNCFAAVKVARELGPGKRIVTILCDAGTRHLSKFWANIGVGGAFDMTIEDVLNAGEKAKKGKDWEERIEAGGVDYEEVAKEGREREEKKGLRSEGYAA